jgi:hypothetical protein
MPFGMLKARKSDTDDTVSLASGDDALDASDLDDSLGDPLTRKPSMLQRATTFLGGNPYGAVGAKDAVNTAKRSGRLARSEAEDVGRTRTQDAVEGVKSIGMAGLEMGLDAASAGVGSAVGAANSVNTIRQAHQNGKSVAEVGGREIATTGAGFIPVVGEFVGMADGAYSVGKAVGQSDKGRTAEKHELAAKTLAGAKAGLTTVDASRDVLAEQNAGQWGSLAESRQEGKHQRRLDKAEQRHHGAIAGVKAWVDKKSAHGTMPMTSAMATDEDVFDPNAAPNITRCEDGKPGWTTF